MFRLVSMVDGPSTPPQPPEHDWVLYAFCLLVACALLCIFIGSLFPGSKSTLCDAKARSKYRVRKRDADQQSILVREVIRHENDLMNHRFTWLVLLQGFLFAGLREGLGRSSQSIVPEVLCFVGVAAAFSAWVVLDAAHNAISHWVGWWDWVKPKRWDEKHVDVIGYKQPYGLFRLLSPWRVLPIVLIVAWSTVFWFQREAKRPPEPAQPPPAAHSPDGATATAGSR